MLFLFYGSFDLAYGPLYVAYPVAFSAMQWKYYFVYIGCLFWFLGAVYFFVSGNEGQVS